MKGTRVNTIIIIFLVCLLLIAQKSFLSEGMAIDNQLEDTEDIKHLREEGLKIVWFKLKEKEKEEKCSNLKDQFTHRYQKIRDLSSADATEIKNLIKDAEDALRDCQGTKAESSLRELITRLNAEAAREKQKQIEAREKSCRDKEESIKRYISNFGGDEGRIKLAMKDVEDALKDCQGTKAESSLSSLREFIVRLNEQAGREKQKQMEDRCEKLHEKYYQEYKSAKGIFNDDEDAMRITLSKVEEAIKECTGTKAQGPLSELSNILKKETR